MVDPLLLDSDPQRRCERAVAAAIDSLPEDHGEIIRVQFETDSCSLHARCLAASSGQTYVRILMRAYSDLFLGPREIGVRFFVTFDANGTILAVKEDAPSRYAPPLNTCGSSCRRAAA
jgi:hypothetical protein